MIIVLSLRIWSIKPNYRMIQPSNISFGGDHQNQSHKIAKDQNQMVYTLEIKVLWMMKNLCVWGVIYGYSSCFIGWLIFIFCIFNVLKYLWQKIIEGKKKNSDADNLCGNKLLPVTQKACVPQYQLLIQWTTYTMSSENHMPHHRSIDKLCMIRLYLILASTNENIIGQMFTEVLKLTEYKYSLWNKISLWLDYIEFRNRLNQFEMFWEHGKCLF